MNRQRVRRTPRFIHFTVGLMVDTHHAMRAGSGPMWPIFASCAILVHFDRLGILMGISLKEAGVVGLEQGGLGRLSDRPSLSWVCLSFARASADRDNAQAPKPRPCLTDNPVSEWPNFFMTGYPDVSRSSRAYLGSPFLKSGSSLRRVSLKGAKIVLIGY